MCFERRHVCVYWVLTLVSAAPGDRRLIVDPARPDQGLAGRFMCVDARNPHQIEQSLDREHGALGSLLLAICGDVGLARDLATPRLVEAEQAENGEVELPPRAPVDADGVQEARPP